MIIAVRAHLRTHAFSGWKRYVITTASGADFHGLVSTSRCYHPDWHPVRPNEPARGEQIFGLVEVSLETDYDPSHPDYALITIQDDTLMVCRWVHKDALVQRPQPSLDELLATRPGAR